EKETTTPANGTSLVGTKWGTSCTFIQKNAKDVRFLDI
ncbi:MAG: hypothetical protein RLZZ443_972, partial [Actinomycetota bacterium]